jgi:hypothetical protein
MSTAEKLEAEAAEILCIELLKLPPGRRNGTADRLVRCLVDAAVARVRTEPPKILCEGWASSEETLMATLRGLPPLHGVVPAAQPAVDNQLQKHQATPARPTLSRKGAP